MFGNNCILLGKAQETADSEDTEEREERLFRKPFKIAIVNFFRSILYKLLLIANKYSRQDKI